MYDFDPRLDRSVPNDIPERPDMDAPVSPRKVPLAFRIVAFTLLGILVVCLLLSLLVHPADQLKFRLMLAQNCTITVQVQKGPGKGEATVKLDNNLLMISSKQDPLDAQYFAIEAGGLYAYEKNLNGQWEKSLRPDSSQLSSGDSRSFSRLFDRDNYVPVEGEWFVWRIKDNVKIDGLTNVRLQMAGGKYVIQAEIAGEYLSYVTITIDRIGTTHIDTPWD